MSDVRPRLETCFAAVFPNVPAEQIPSASVENTPAWDSLATAGLLAVLEEEFGVTVELEELETLTSFELIAKMLEGRLT